MRRNFGAFPVYVLAATLLFGFIFSTAWACDDAYITIRTIDNWRSGYGLRWNVDERVQPYTHPLWLFAEAGAWTITGEPYFSSMALSIACAAVGAVLLTSLAWSRAAAAAGLLVLAGSVAFVDFATSGLETPLTYLLVAAFLAAYWGRERATLWTSSFAALLAVNRLDLGLLVAPAMLDIAWQSRRDAKRWFLIGLLPLVAWELFSLVYYGSPVPNTGYAKLATGIPQPALTHQGLVYLAHTWHVDPLTPGTIAVAIALVLWRPRRTTAIIAAGIVLTIAYVVHVGGDFMNGRFLVPSFVAAVGLLLRQPTTPRQRAVVVSAMSVAAALSLPHATSRAVDRGPYPPIDVLIGEDGVADERFVYARATSLVDAIRHRTPPDHEWERAGRQTRDAGLRVVAQDSVGFFGYGAGPSVHIVDAFALCDPLLARLPALEPWRIGHFYRDIPEGYLEMLRGEREHLEDPVLDAYYAKIRLVTRGPLWSWSRWSAIADLNLRERVFRQPARQAANSTGTRFGISPLSNASDMSRSTPRRPRSP
jgi:arabinofuranosyltransferase